VGGGGGEIICNIGGKTIIDFTWGIGSMTNNEAEVYAVYVGIKLAHSKGIRSLIICRDSMMVIRAVVKGNITRGNIYSGIMSRSLVALKNFEKSTMYHVKREINVEANKLTKVGSRLGKGDIVVNGILRFQPIA